MSQQIKYKDEIIKELQDVLDEDIPELLEVIKNLKAGKKKGKKRAIAKKEKVPLWDLKNIAIETGIEDLAEHHDHYLYGVTK
ncbi:MAG: hypothetical protein B6D35_04965 [Candidatus Brocadia sp. UTAMX2]|jgi:hypothetical protein|nr:MAG: hypothetical protein B6D35_04965 [Candidatus Brocadia sp. UTAMX2]